MIREGLVSSAAARGKYAPLYHHLSARSEAEWCTSFGEVEAILGFRLPDSARRYRGWWSNRRKDGGPQPAGPAGISGEEWLQRRAREGSNGAAW